MDYYQSINRGNTIKDDSFWYKLCNCCPYGYHIDLDFVHYCNSLEHVDHTASMKRRKDRRRQRRSMVVLLGLEPLSTNQASTKDQHVVQQPLESVQESLPPDTPHVVNDGLHDAVLDFEQTLQNSTASDGHAHISNIYETFSYPLSPKTALPHLKMAMPSNTSKPDGSMEQDFNSLSCGVLPANLQNIREQMALSLERTKIVEELVKHIPLLQAQLAELKEEKRQLLLQIKMNKEENHCINGQLYSRTSLTLPSKTMPHRRDFGVTCSLLSPLEDSKSYQTSTFCWKVDGYADKWYKEKSSFLNDSGFNTSSSNNIPNKKSNAITVTKETQTILPRIKKDFSNQTQALGHIQELKKVFRSVESAASVCTAESGTEPIIIPVSSIGVSEDTVDAILCLKCVSESSPTFHNKSSRTIGSQYEQILKHISVQCDTEISRNDYRNIIVDVATNTDIETLQKAIMHSVGCQYVNISVDKASQVYLKLNNKAVQNDMTFETPKNIPEKIQVNTATNTDVETVPKKEVHSVGSQYTRFNLDKTSQVYLKLHDKAIQHNISLDRANVATNTDIEMLPKKEIFNLDKASQINLKLKDKAIQHDLPFEASAGEFCSKCSTAKNEMTMSIDTSLNKQSSNKISLSSLTVSRSKSFCSFDTSSRTVGGQYEPSTQIIPDVLDMGAQCDNISYFTRFKTKLGPKETSYERESSLKDSFHKETDSTLKDDSVIVPSRIPRLQVLESKRLRRQDTYDIDLSKTADALMGENVEHVDQAETFAVSEKVNYESSSPSNFSTELPLYSETDTERKKITPSKSMRAALKVLSDCLKKGQTENLEDQLKNSINIVQLEWFKISSLIDAKPLDVEDYLDFFEDISFILLKYIVNMVDANGNTAMHYAVSHGNFDVVSILLDSKVCDINQTNKVGYTSVMLVSLVEISSPEHANVVRRLFKLADVNVKAKQHGQTALMLAVSHGRLDMVQMLLEAGADINIQDEDGSTALMCASEHGHIEIIKLFLDQPECDSSIADIDGSTALTIAMEAGHRPIGVLLYTHQRIRKSTIQRSRSS